MLIYYMESNFSEYQVYIKVKRKYKFFENVYATFLLIFIANMCSTLVNKLFLNMLYKLKKIGLD